MVQESQQGGGWFAPTSCFFPPPQITPYQKFSPNQIHPLSIHHQLRVLLFFSKGLGGIPKKREKPSKKSPSCLIESWCVGVGLTHPLTQVKANGFLSLEMVENDGCWRNDKLPSRSLPDRQRFKFNAKRRSWSAKSVRMFFPNETEKTGNGWIIKWDPFWGIKQCTCMVISRVFPLRGHCLGW